MAKKASWGAEGFHIGRTKPTLAQRIKKRRAASKVTKISRRKNR